MMLTSFVGSDAFGRPMAFNHFIHKYVLKNKVTSKIKIEQSLSSFYLICIGIFLEDGSFTTDIGIVKLHPKVGTHWVVYNNQNYFHAYGCPHLKVFLIIKKVNMEIVFTLNLELKKIKAFVLLMFYIYITWQMS